MSRRIPIKALLKLESGLFGIFLRQSATIDQFLDYDWIFNDRGKFLPEHGNGNFTVFPDNFRFPGHAQSERLQFGIIGKNSLTTFVQNFPVHASFPDAGSAIFDNPLRQFVRDWNFPGK